MMWLSVVGAGLLVLFLVTRNKDRTAGTLTGHRDLRTTKRDGGQRVVLGRSASASWLRLPSRLLAPRDHSVLVVGPTQSGKTSSIVIPTIAAWDGPVVVASVKDDLVTSTAAQRSECGDVVVIDPTRSHGRMSRHVDPVALISDFDSAKRIAFSLCDTNAEGPQSSESQFWNQMAAKTLAVLCYAASLSTRSISEVITWVNQGENISWLALISASQDGAAKEIAQACARRDERQAASIAATMEAVLEPFSDAPSDRSLTFEHFFDAPNSLYFCAPAFEQRRYRAMFVLAVEEVIRRAYEQAQREGGRLSKPLLVVLDEAAAIAPLRELDVIAATCASHGIVLLCVFQDLTQIHARWPGRADSIVNNHRTRVLLSGSSDPLVGTMVNQALGVMSASDQQYSFDIRTLRSYRGIVLSGALQPIRLALMKPRIPKRKQLARLDGWRSRSAST